MIILRVLFVVILAVKGLVCLQPLMSTVNFCYTYEDVLDIDIILQNVPQEASSYVLHYQTDNCNNENTVALSNQGTRCNDPSQPKKIPTNRTITITQNLNKGSVRVYLELRNSYRSCSTKIVMDGVRDSAVANTAENKFRTSCLNTRNYSKPCQIFVDFNNTCEEKSPARMNCTEFQGYLKCAVLTDNELPNDTLHQWYQRFGERLPFNIPSANGKKTTYRTKLHKFDSNNVISSHMSSTSLNKDIYSELYKITSPINGEYYVERKNIFNSKSELFNFACEPNHERIQIGFIDPEGYTITTYNTTRVSWRLTKQDQNSILCCIYYTVYSMEDTIVVERFVEDFTKMIYYDETAPLPNASSTLSTTSIRTTTKTLTPPTEVSMTLPEKSTWLTKKPTAPTPTAIRSTEASTIPPALAKTTNNDTTKYFIIPAAVAGTIILIALIYVISKKYFRKSPDPEQTLDLETYATPGNMVLYAELEMRPSGSAQAPPDTDNSTYAQIIGVLKPRHENNIK